MDAWIQSLVHTHSVRRERREYNSTPIMPKINTLQAFLKAYPVVNRVVVKWGDMDAFKHVNNTIYFKYQEVSRLKFFSVFLNEINPTTFDICRFNEGSGLGPILADTSISFKFPLTYPDIILVGATVKEGDMSKDRYKMTHSIWSLRHSRIAAEGHGTVVSYNFETGKVQDMPDVMVDAINTVVCGDSLHMLPGLQGTFQFDE